MIIGSLDEVAKANIDAAYGYPLRRMAIRCRLAHLAARAERKRRNRKAVR